MRHRQRQWFQRRESENETDKGGFVRETSREGETSELLEARKNYK